MPKKIEEEKCEHCFYPLSVDSEYEFIVLECANCGEKIWRHTFFLTIEENL